MVEGLAVAITETSRHWSPRRTMVWYLRAVSAMAPTSVGITYFARISRGMVS